MFNLPGRGPYDPYEEFEFVRRPSARARSKRKREVYVQRRAFTRPSPRDEWSRHGLPRYDLVKRLLAIYAGTGEGLGAFINAQMSVEREYGPGAARLDPAYPYYPRHHPGSDDEDGPGRPPSLPKPTPPQPPASPSAGSSDGSSDGPSAPPHPPPPVYISPRGRPTATPHAEINIVVEAAAGEHGRPQRQEVVLIRNRAEGRGRRTRVHRRPQYQAYVEEVVDDEDEELDYADVPAAQEDFRLRTRAENSRRLSRRHESQRVEITRDGMRGGAATCSDDGQFDSRRDKDHSIRMRGGAPDTRSQRPTVMGPIGAGTLPGPTDRISTKSREIVLTFFYISRGKIELSRKPEVYTTFQEFRSNPIINQDQVSDRWFVNKLQQQYCIITRRSRGWFQNMFLMRTIGFANFLRFEESPEEKGSYILSAKAPAITSQTEPTSQFRYQIRRPFEYKIMLATLDLLTSTSSWTKNEILYMVEIKEAPDTSKIYTLLGLLILVSTGGGTTYAVIQADVGAGISIATYALTCLSLFLALTAAGQWLGLTQPNAFSYAYSAEENLFWGFQNVDDAISAPPYFTRRDRR